MQASKDKQTSWKLEAQPRTWATSEAIELHFESSDSFTLSRAQCSHGPHDILWGQAAVALKASHQRRGEGNEGLDDESLERCGSSYQSESCCKVGGGMMGNRWNTVSKALFWGWLGMSELWGLDCLEVDSARLSLTWTFSCELKGLGKGSTGSSGTVMVLSLEDSYARVLSTGLSVRSCQAIFNVCPFSFCVGCPALWRKKAGQGTWCSIRTEEGFSARFFLSEVVRTSDGHVGPWPGAEMRDASCKNKGRNWKHQKKNQFWGRWQGFSKTDAPHPSFFFYFCLRVGYWPFWPDAKCFAKHHREARWLLCKPRWVHWRTNHRLRGT